MTVVCQISDLPSPPRLPLLGNAHQLVRASRLHMTGIDLRNRATEVRDECLALPEITKAVEVLEAYTSERTSRS